MKISFFESNDLQWKNLCGVCSELKVKGLAPQKGWLSKENVVGRVFELKNEIKQFLKMKGKHEFMTHFIDETWIQRVAYLSDI